MWQEENYFYLAPRAKAREEGTETLSSVAHMRGKTLTVTNVCQQDNNLIFVRRRQLRFKIILATYNKKTYTARRCRGNEVRDTREQHPEGSTEFGVECIQGQENMGRVIKEPGFNKKYSKRG